MRRRDEGRITIDKDNTTIVDGYASRGAEKLQERLAKLVGVEGAVIVMEVKKKRRRYVLNRQTVGGGRQRRPPSAVAAGQHGRPII